MNKIGRQRQDQWTQEHDQADMNRLMRDMNMIRKTGTRSGRQEQESVKT